MRGRDVVADGSGGSQDAVEVHVSWISCVCCKFLFSLCHLKYT